MVDLVESRIGFIDIYHGKAKNNGNDKAPHFEGQLKLSEGTIIRLKLWRELKENVPNNEKFSGYIYKLEEKKTDNPF